MGTTTSDTTFTVSKDGKYVTFMAMSLWKRTFEKSQKLDELIKTLKGYHPDMEDVQEWLDEVEERWVHLSTQRAIEEEA